MMNKFLLVVFFGLCLTACKVEKKKTGMQALRVSENKRFLMTADGKPFFWLGDTGWLLLNKLDRKEADQYLEDRRKKGFNVIQVMVLHTIPEKNIYGRLALKGGDVSKPDTTKGNLYSDSVQYDYWDHLDYMVDLAEKKGIYMALVPVWGSPVKSGKVSPQQAGAYAAFLAKRYRGKTNIIWMNGGDIKGSDSIKVWQNIGRTLRANDPNHLITFHPRGRSQSSFWFHSAPWLDFNMVQSGHQRYEQDTSKKEKLHYGEDNWKYIEADYLLKPARPSIDGEPSYEGIPQGLHDIKQPRWTAADVRRYGYWSVFAGAFGYTYGQNSVMQMHRKEDKESAYGSDELWTSAINAPGASQMVYLKQLMLSRSFFDRVPDQSLVVLNENEGAPAEKYDKILATRGKDYIMAYTYTGRDFSLNMGSIAGEKVKASWFNPRTGKTTGFGEILNSGTAKFNPPGDKKNGNDWVLILDRI
ncbi:Putative collagen-binding domain of a collagenase [Pedobacter westerhofensis]|uniref:Collagen-binding domain of a collagenase n=2 Tax=Pedobacter westerhofensis TaxID=425512 RepID=A0A521AM67_9SPHI|nr:Putative collagen-binding domain of a collagenase [Pedobacter westerhofensis]